MAKRKNKSNRPSSAASPARADVLVQAIGHPVRVQMLERLATETASAKQLSDSLEVPLGIASYHLRTVLDQECGLVEVVDTRQRRGAIETFYRLDACALRNAVSWKHLTGPVGDLLHRELVQGFLNLLTEAQFAGTLGGDPAETLSCQPI